jgi:hypothetical protein
MRYVFLPFSGGGKRGMSALILNSAMQDIIIQVSGFDLSIGIEDQVDLISAALGPKSPWEA